MSLEDKYPAESGRRRFVKGVVGAASLSSVGSVGTVALDLTTAPTGAGGGITQYFGVENTDGPAPRGMPIVPIEIDDEGYIRGVYPEVQEVEQQGQTVTVARQELGGIEYSVEWFQYCGIQSYQGLQPSYDGDNYFRYSEDPPYEWQSDVTPGQRVNISDFDDYRTWGNGIGRSGLGKPAAVTWRSQDAEDTIPVEIIRSPRYEQMANEGDGPVANFLSAATDQGVFAHLNKCTHFCCVPGFKASAQSIQFESENEIYCPCHQSVYDPFSIVQLSFVAYPRPEED